MQSTANVVLTSNAKYSSCCAYRIYVINMLYCHSLC